MPYGSLSGMEWMIVRGNNLLPSFLIPALFLANTQAKEMNKNLAHTFACLTFSCKAVLATV